MNGSGGLPLGKGAVGPVLAALLAASCIDFDARLAACADGGGPCAPDGGSAGDGGADGGAAGWCVNGFCWVNPTPFGEDLQAVTGTSESDVWVGGPGGFVAHWDGTAWSDRRVDGGLVPGPARPEVLTLLATDGQVWVAGDGLLPQRWGGTAWVPETYGMNGTGARMVSQLRLAGDRLMAIGARSSRTLVAVRNDAGAWNELAYDYPELVTAISDEASPLLATWDYGDVRIRAMDGSEVLRLPDAGRELVSLWQEPGVGLWAAGPYCSVFQLADGGAGPNLCGNLETTFTTFFAGGWVPGVGNVVAGTYGVIAEGGAAGFARALTVEVPGYPVVYRALWASADGGLALAVGSGGTLARRQADGTWATQALGTRMATHAKVGALFATDAGVLAAGAGMSLSLESGGALSELRAAGPVSDYQGVWADESTIYTVDNGGNICTASWDSPHQAECIWFENQSFAAIAGTSALDVFVVGANGAVRELDGGVWAPVAAPAVDFTAALALRGRRLVADLSGAVSECLAGAGAFAPVFAGDAGLYALAAAPTGELFAAGDWNTVATWRADAGWRSQRLTSLRQVTLRGACAFAADDAWVVGDDGMALHWDGGTWGYAETGTRLQLTSAACVQAGTRRTLVVGGDWGAVLQKTSSP